jgi:hypothetical protein
MTTPTPPSGNYAVIARQRAPFWVEVTAIPIGVAIAGFFGWLLYLEVKTPPTHTTHIAIFASFILLGLLVAFGRFFLFPVIQQVIVIAQGTEIPWIGGRRKSDPPAPGAAQ